MNIHLRPSLIALTAVLASACQSAEPEDEAAEIQAALELEDGGMTLEDEQPAFGDPAVIDSPEMIDGYADSMALPDDGRARYRVMLIWGNVPRPDDNATEPRPAAPLDWSGSVRVNGGAIRVLRTLRFDPRDGVAPRTSPDEVSFVSHTLPHMDGLLLEIGAPEGGALDFDTAALTTSLDLGALDHGVVPLGDGTNALIYAGAPVDGCPSGFIMGHWQNREANLGRFRGRVISDGGDALGHLRGIFGRSQRFGGPRFFGKYIDENGQARGLFGGSYGEGEFQGRWGTREPHREGLLHGRYSTGVEESDNRGVLLGRWREACE